MKKNYVLLALSTISILMPSFLHAWNDVSGTWWPNYPEDIAGSVPAWCEANKSELTSLSCDKDFDFTLRYDDTYYFNDTFRANQWDKYLWFFCSFFDNHGTDYSNWVGKPVFSWTPWVEDNDRKVSSNTEREIIRSTNYHIGAVPAWGRNRDNITLRYVVFYSSDEAWNNKFKPHVECWHYAISRCGDGKVDKKSDTSFLWWLETYQEEQCDPNDPNKEWWGDDGCSASCKPLNSKCGDGKKSWNEKCDPNDPNKEWWWDDGCSASCEPLNSKCGDGKKSWNEKCDPNDPNKEWWWDDGCSASCEPLNSKCGDGKKSWNEECDPSDPNKEWWGNDGCSASCEPLNSSCGDGKKSWNEKCDPSDPNKEWWGNDGCSASCEPLNSSCGDGKKSWNEKCDPNDPNKEWWGNDGCSASCEPLNSSCGDGKKSWNEKCDPNDPNKEWWGNGWCSLICEPINISNSCDKTVTWQKLRLNRYYVFDDEFDSKWTTRYLYDFSVKFEERHWDYDNNPSKPNFSWTSWLVNNGMKVEAWNKWIVLTSPLDPKYHIVSTPTHRAWDNLYIEYVIRYDDQYHSTKPSNNNLYSHKECAYYEITRCGDGIIDSEYGEKCDPNDPNKEWWGNGWCDKETCTPTNVKVPVCNSQYNGQVVENLTENDNLCSEWTYVPGSLHFNETTNTWTWECDNVAWEWVNCSATKKAKDWRLEPLKTLIGTNKVTKVWDEIIWSLKVTAKDGDVSDFIMSDTMPPVLWYKDYEVLHKWSVDSITFLWENKQNNSVSWKVSWTLKENDYVEIKLITYAKEMPKKEEVNVLCVRPENEENNKECDDKKIPPVCNSDYNGQTLDELPSEDELCNVWKATTPKYDEKTQRWTWNCVEDWETVGCWARKEGSKTQTWRLEPLKTLIWPKEIHSTWDEITWSLKVTAKDGDVSDFIMSDTMPPVLWYKDYEVLHKWSVDSITFLWENKQNNSVSWKVSWTLKEEDYVEIRLITYAKEMPDKEEKNVLCVRPENEENNKKCDEKPIYSPKLRIKKSFTEWDNGKIVKIWDKIGYKIEFGNNGDASATITSIKDFLPKNVEYITWKIFLDTDSEHEKQESWSEIIDIERWVPHIAKTVDGVRVDIYTGITLKPGQNGYIILTGEVKDEFTGSRTNFACIYLDNKKIDCDDVTHNITPEEVMCATPILNPSSHKVWEGKEVKWSTTVTCKSDWWDADTISIYCGKVSPDNLLLTKKNVSVASWVCEFSWKWNHDVRCEVNGSTKRANGDECKWVYNLSQHEDHGDTSPECSKPDFNPKNISSNGEDIKVTCSAIVSNARIGIDCNYPKDTPLYSYDFDSSATSQSTEEITDKHTFTCKNVKENQEIACFVYTKWKWRSPPDKCRRTVEIETKKCGSDCDSHNGTKNCDDYTVKQRQKIVWCNIANPHCFNINAWNVSIEMGEYLPLYRNVMAGGDDGSLDFRYEWVDGNIDGACGEDQEWVVALNSMKCTYTILDPENDEVHSKTLPCFTKTAPIVKPLIQKWIERQFGVYGPMQTLVGGNNNLYLKFWDTKSDEWKKKNGQKITDLWEYKVQITNLEYKECTANRKWETYNQKGVCQSNFVLTEPYTVQKTPSGNLKASTTTLAKFKQVDGEDITSFSKYLTAMSTTDYNKNSKVDDAMKNFRDKYEKLAVNVNNEKYPSLKKVPGKNIYFIDRDFTIKGGTFDKAFTIVQKGEKNKVTIDWSVENLNMMILTDWTIEFKWDCISDQTVKWIFVWGTLERYWVDKNNDNDDKHPWCYEWWLHIKWVLIWGGFENLMKESRSHLNDWRKRNSNERDGDASQLKKKIMDWASVVIEYSPSIFTQSTMPPGAEYFTTALDIYKK